MNILFLTLIGFNTVYERGLYQDLLREFLKEGHKIYAISPTERREGEGTHLVKKENVTILRLQIGNIQKTNIIEKGISTVMIGLAFRSAIKKYFSNVKFGLVLYSTPPITFVSAIEYVKKRDGSKTYLLLKDIFPQNAVDIGMMSTTGLKGLLYKHFRNQEKKLYKVSDRLGCMSQANVDYIIKHNSEVKPEIVEVCPNAIEVVDKSINEKTRIALRKKYEIPLNKNVFVYGGNLGKPQGIPFLIECLRKCQNIDDAFFLIVGDGTEYHLLQDYMRDERPKNVRLMRHLPKEDYDTVVGACDVGLLFLDHRFTIPNFPSRMLSYMQAKLPILACTDPNTDIGKVIVNGKFGWECESNDSAKFRDIICQIETTEKMKENAFEFLSLNYNVKKAYQTIIKSMKGR